MAMTLPIPNSPTSSASPETPASPTAASDASKDSNSTTGSSPTTHPNGQPIKRKASRRANTAERRATHNAVERARRETLNGRFLDLAALLPNLSQIRRPSKSAIVNSSIAHIHAARRHRLLAARELRLLKLESDALRRELNEWRDRAGLPRVEEPMRSEGFSIVASGEVEVLPVPTGEDSEEDEEEFVQQPSPPQQPQQEEIVSLEDMRAVAMMKAPALNLARPSPFDQSGGLFDVGAAWNVQGMYPTPQQHQHQQNANLNNGMFTPPPSAGKAFFGGGMGVGVYEEGGRARSASASFGMGEVPRRMWEMGGMGVGMMNNGMGMSGHGMGMNGMGVGGVGMKALAVGGGNGFGMMM